MTDLEHSARFYDAILEPLGFRRLWGDADAVGYGIAGQDESFAIKRDAPGSVACSVGLHIAFQASSADTVVRFYEAAIVSGGVSDAPAGLQPEYGPSYFAAFVYNPDGYRIEALYHGV